jgi:hypothetical protein
MDIGAAVLKSYCKGTYKRRQTAVHSPYSGVPVMDENATKVDALLVRIAKGVQITNELRIREYLLQFADIAEVVLPAVEAAQRRFPEAQ